MIRDRMLSTGLALCLLGAASAAMAAEAPNPEDTKTPLSSAETKEAPRAVILKKDEEAERKTGFLPGSRLFPASIADPRRVAFTGGIRYHDDAFNRYRTRYGSDSHVLGSDKTFGAVSLGSRLPLYRWDVTRGNLQADIEGSVWALFAFKKPHGWLGEGSTLLNADYYMGFITSYAYGNLALQLRFWHMSSHLGDEFIELYPEIRRKNVSIEGADVFTSYAIVSQLRLFVGVGGIYHSWKDSRFDPFYVEYGVEIRPFNSVSMGKNARFQPFIAAHLKNWQNNHFALNGNYSIGIEFAAYRNDFKPKMQLYFTFSHGPSQEGQFYKVSTTYYSLALALQLI